MRRLHLELARAKENEASLLHSHIARICHCPFFLYTSPDVLYLHGRFVHDLTSRAVTRTRRARTRRRATAIAPCGCCSSPRTRRRLGGHSSSRGRGGQKSLTPHFPPQYVTLPIMNRFYFSHAFEWFRMFSLVWSTGAVKRARCSARHTAIGGGMQKAPLSSSFSAGARKMRSKWPQRLGRWGIPYLANPHPTHPPARLPLLLLYLRDLYMYSSPPPPSTP